MLTEEQYQVCRPVLEDASIEEEVKIEMLEDLLRKNYKFDQGALENTILDALWRHRNTVKGDDRDIAMRHAVIRKASPAPWQMNRAPTPLASPPASSSPALSSAFPVSRPSFSRQRSIASPFASPRPSPRLAMAQSIPHSPNLNAYEFSDSGPAPDIYGDYGSDTVDWLVGDETASNASSTGTLSAAAPEWIPQNDMSPYDILRSVLGDKLSDDQIEGELEKHSFDLSATIASLLGSEALEPQANSMSSNESTVLVGKSLISTPTSHARPMTPGSSKSTIVCKYWLASGSCLRADCRFAHDTSTYLCKYWMNRQCLAGDACQFSHDPSLLMGSLSMNESAVSSPASIFQLQDQSDHFPSLGSPTPSRSVLSQGSQANGYFANPGITHRNKSGLGVSSRPQSRPGSRHQNRPETPSSLSVDDPEAFPTLGSISAKRGSKHHGHRSRHGHNERDVPSSLADVVKMSSSPSPTQVRKTEVVRKIRPSGGLGGTDMDPARNIPEPQHIPWLETGARANQQYLKYRQEAIKHGSIRNKFLQSAAQAWNRNDARAAKALSLRGQAENDAMRKAHRDAAKALYEERNKHLTSRQNEEEDELYIDLHGLHPEEAIEYLEDILMENARSGRRVIYAITGTGHHSKNGKDKVGKGVRSWLNEWGYTFREFSVPGERGGYIGGVLGIDCTTHRRESQQQPNKKEFVSPSSVRGKIQVLKREEVAI